MKRTRVFLLMMLATGVASAQPEPIDVPTTPAELNRVLDDLARFAVENHQDPPGALFTALQKISDPKLVPTLGDRLLKSPQWMVKVGCLMPLSEMNTRESTDALRRFFKSVPTWTGKDEEQAKLGIRTEVDRWMYTGSVTLAGKTLVARGEFASIKDDLKRHQMVEELAAGGRDGLELLIDLAAEVAGGKTLNRGNDVELRDAFASVRSRDCLDLLRATAFDPGLPEPVRVGAMTALAEGWGADEYATMAAIAATERNSNVRRKAYALAAALNPKAAKDLLLPLLKDPRPRMRGYAAYLLGTLGDGTLIPPLVERLGDDDEGVRLLALEGLWLLEYRERTLQWADPKHAEAYRDFMRKHPKPEAPAERTPESAAPN